MNTLAKPINPLIIAQALRRMQQGPQLPSAIMFRQAQQRWDDSQNRYTQPIPASGPANAALIGVMSGISKVLARKGYEGRLQEAYEVYETERADAAAAEMAEQQRKAEEAEKARQAARGDANEDWVMREKYKRENPMPMHPKDQLQMQKLEVDMANIRQGMERNANREDREQIAFEQEQAASAEQQQRVSQERDRALQLVDSLLSPDRSKDLERATGTIDGALVSLRQGTVDWENDFKALGDLLTMDNLGRMSGVLSESDIKLLRDAASGGLNLRSGSDVVRQKLGSIRGALQGSKPQSNQNTVRWEDL